MDDNMVTNLFVDGLDPLHVRDRVLRVIPMLRVAAPQFVDERLKLITISAYKGVNISDVTKSQGTYVVHPRFPYCFSVRFRIRPPSCSELSTVM